MSLAAGAARRMLPGVALVAVIGFVYFDALWGVPRFDQLGYLYQAALFRDWGDLLSHSPSWNRWFLGGDRLLYRPLLYALLAVEYRLFGLRFELWQAVGIGLHAIQSLLLLRLLQLAFPGVASALVAAALFSVSAIASEMVIWHHINGYLLCTTFATLSLLSLLDHRATGRAAPACVSLGSALLATLAFEVGAVYSLVVGWALVWPAARGLADRSDRARRRLWLPIGFLAVPSVYALLSGLDYVAHFGGRPPLAASAIQAAHVWHGLGLALYQLVFWLGGFLLPSIFVIVPADRAMVMGFRSWLDPWVLVNVLAAGAAVVGALGLVRRHWRRALPGFAPGAAVLFLFSCVIAFGRSVDRTIAYTTGWNLHYSYVAILALLAAVAVAAASLRGDEHAGAAAEPAGTPRSTWPSLLLGGMIGLLLVNAVESRSLFADYRHVYGAPRNELLYHARRWHEESPPGAFFTVPATCPGNAPLPWFGAQARGGQVKFSFLDTIYPRTSWNVNEGEPWTRGARVTPLACRPATVRPEDLLGRWISGGSIGTIRAASTGALEITNETGGQSPLVVAEGILAATGWSVFGILSHDGRYIFWLNGAIWRRASRPAG